MKIVLTRAQGQLFVYKNFFIPSSFSCYTCRSILFVLPDQMSASYSCYRLLRLKWVGISFTSNMKFSLID